MFSENTNREIQIGVSEVPFGNKQRTNTTRKKTSRSIQNKIGTYKSGNTIRTNTNRRILIGRYKSYNKNKVNNVNMETHTGKYESEIQNGKYNSGIQMGKYSSRNTNRKIQIETMQLGRHNSENTTRGISIGRCKSDKLTS